MRIDHISRKNHQDWSIVAEIMPILIQQKWSRLVNLDLSSFQPILPTQMVMQRLLVIIGPIDTMKMTILAKKNHQDWSIGVEIMPILISQKLQHLVNLDQSSFQPIPPTQMVMQRLLVIIGPTGTWKLTILAKKITKIGQLWLKLWCFSYRREQAGFWFMAIPG